MKTSKAQVLSTKKARDDFPKVSEELRLFFKAA
jgi:hypothetical protein